MKVADYLRRQAAELRAMAAILTDAGARAKVEELAASCEKLANDMQGNGKDLH